MADTISAVIAAVAALSGVALGKWWDARERVREDRRKLESERRLAYARLLDAAKTLTHSAEDVAWNEYRRAAALVDLIGSGRARFEADRFLEAKRVRPDNSVVVTMEAYEELVRAIRYEALGTE